MRLWGLPTFQSAKDIEELKKYSAILANAVSQGYTNGFTFRENVKCQTVLVGPEVNPTNGTIAWNSTNPTAVFHTLGTQAWGFIVVDKDGAGDVWRPVSPVSTDAKIVLQTNTPATTYKIMIMG